MPYARVLYDILYLGRGKKKNKISSRRFMLNISVAENINLHANIPIKYYKILFVRNDVVGGIRAGNAVGLVNCMKEVGSGKGKKPVGLVVGAIGFDEGSAYALLVVSGLPILNVRLTVWQLVKENIRST